MTRVRTAVDEFTRAYVTAMLWSSTDDETPLDRDHDVDDLSDLAWARVLNDCARFQRVNSAELTACDGMASRGEWSLPPGVKCSVLEYAGHDFWLTRAGHGCGFWDGDWPDPYADLLTHSAKSFGELTPYVGDDGQIHLD